MSCAGLKVEPEAGVSAKITSEPDRCVRVYIALPAHDLGEAVWRHAERLREEWEQIFFAEHCAGMRAYTGHGVSFIDNR
jgi:hypothetical protein